MKLFCDLRDKVINCLPVDLTHGVKSEKFRQTFSRPYPGTTWNPLKKYPVNARCWCGSLTKAKKCCQPYVKAVVSEETADNILSNWKQILAGEVTLPKSPKSPQ